MLCNRGHQALKALVSAALAWWLPMVTPTHEPAAWLACHDAPPLGGSPPGLGVAASAFVALALYELCVDPVMLAGAGKPAPVLVATVLHHLAVLVWAVVQVALPMRDGARWVLARQMWVMCAYRAALYTRCSLRARRGKHATACLGALQFVPLAVYPAIKLLGCPLGPGSGAPHRVEVGLAAAQALFLGGMACVGLISLSREAGLVLVRRLEGGRPLLRPLWVPRGLLQL